MLESKTISLAKGLRVHTPHFALDDDESTIIALQMLGPEQSVKANWSSLMQGGKSSYIQGTRVKLSGSKSHITLRKALPCGWFELWLIHKQASHVAMIPNEPFYILSLDKACPEPVEGTASEPVEWTVPPSFFLMLDRALPLPMLPHWSEWLWHVGVDRYLIKRAAYFGDAHNANAWRVIPDASQWEEIIQSGIQNGSISF